MIKLTRLDGERFVLNADLIRYVEQRPDTFITLTTGERFVVAESLDQVVDLAVDYQQRKHLFPSIPQNNLSQNISVNDLQVPAAGYVSPSAARPLVERTQD